VKKLIFIEAGIILVISCVTVGIVMWISMNPEPDLPELAVLPSPPPEVPAGIITSDTAQTITEVELPAGDDPLVFPTQSVQEILANPTPTALPAGVPTPVPVCGGPAEIIVLGVGVDTRGTGYTYGLADVIRIARFDFINPKVSVIALPRDLWVEIPGLSNSNEVTHGKLNQAYYYGLESAGYAPQTAGGPELLAATLDRNFDLQVDNYVTVNMITLEKIIDAVDGIKIYLPYDVDGMSTLEEDPFDLGYFERGYHHLDGETAVRLARIRLVDDVFHRANRQSLVLYGLQEKLLSPSVLPRIPKLIMAFEDAVKTNLTAQQIRQLTCLAPHINRHNLMMTNLPRDLFTAATIEVENYTKPVFVWETDFEVIRQLLDLFQNGFWPQ